MLKTQKIPVIINCDTGIDDAVAIMIGVKSEKLDIKLITTDVGNVNTRQSAINTLNVLEILHAPEIPVVVGDGRCFVRERARFTAHGNNGLGGFELKNNPRKITEGDAVEEMYKTIMKSEQKITIICISPTTNLARLFTEHTDCIDKIERVVVMAGSIEDIGENEMPYPEFNVSGDPEAGEVLLNSNVDIMIVPMEMGHTAYLDWKDVFDTKNLNNTGEILEKIYRSYKDRHVKNGIATHDGCAVAYLTNPELFEVSDVFAEIKYYDSIDTGVLVMDFDKSPNTKTCIKVNTQKFKKLYFKCLKKCDWMGIVIY